MKGSLKLCSWLAQLPRPPLSSPAPANHHSYLGGNRKVETDKSELAPLKPCACCQCGRRLECLTSRGNGNRGGSGCRHSGITWERGHKAAVDADTETLLVAHSLEPDGLLTRCRWLTHWTSALQKGKHEQHSHTKKKLPLHLSQLAGSSFKGTLSSLFLKKGIAKVIRNKQEQQR